MQIDDARRSLEWLMLKVSPVDSLKWLATFKAGEYEIKPVRKKRSLDANAYCFVLLDKLSAALGVSKEELYRRYVKEVGGVSDTVCVKNVAVDRLVSNWESKGLGWQTETFPSKLDGCTNVILYYGSSVYDTKQMSRLIDLIVQDCMSIGIETKSENEIESLLSEWGEN